MTTRQARIEQALAFGRSDQWIITNLGVTSSEIENARRNIDRVNLERDTVANVRDEMALIYGGVVREHHTHSEPLDPAVTKWERHQLARACHTLTSRSA